MDFPISDSHSRMGRPPMNVKATVVRLGDGVPERIDAVLKPKEKRADLIREAIERELKRREGKLQLKK
jgi:predicted DNA-binding protein